MSVASKVEKSCVRGPHACPELCHPGPCPRCTAVGSSCELLGVVRWGAPAAATAAASRRPPRGAVTQRNGAAVPLVASRWPVVATAAPPGGAEAPAPWCGQVP